MVDNENTNETPNNIIFTVKDTKLHVSVVTLSAKDNQKLSKLQSKDQFLGINIKQKVRIKIPQMIMDFFSNQIWLELIDYLH